MKKRTNIINNVIMIISIVALAMVAVVLCSKFFGLDNLLLVIGLFLIGALLAGVINAFVHEFGHIVAGKSNKFTLISFTVWFFRWNKVKDKLRFSFVMMGDESGYTEMVANGTDNLEKRYKTLTLGGIFASLAMTVVSIIPLCLGDFLPMEVYYLLSPFLPISAYYLLGNALPMSSEGVRNDGAVVYGLNKQDDVSMVTLSLMAMQSEILGGKTPAQVDQKYYFEVPQLPEDDLTFIMLLSARYAYYLDKGDYENAKKITERLSTLYDYIPKSMQPIFLADELYNACTFDFNEDRADELMYECEKYLNGVNTATTVRIKLAYMLNVVKNEDEDGMFYKKGVRETKRTPLIGYGLFEKSLLDQLVEKDGEDKDAVNENSDADKYEDEVQDKEE